MTAKRRDIERFLSELGAQAKRIQSGANYYSKIAAEVEASANQFLQSHNSAFSEWVRGEAELNSRTAGLCIVNGDWIIHQFRCTEDTNGPRTSNNLMLIEEKTHGASPSFAQMDTLAILDQLLMNNKERKDRARKITVKTGRGDMVCCKYYGLHYLIFSGAGPLDSELITWDARPISVEQLKMILRFAIHPITLAVRDTTERRHHKNKLTQNPLFDGMME